MFFDCRVCGEAVASVVALGPPASGAAAPRDRGPTA